MKKILSILTIFVILFTSCKKDFDPMMYGTLSPVTFPKTEVEFELYTLAVYKPFQAKWGYQELDWQNNFFSYEYGYVQMFDAPTDLMAVFPEWGGFFEAFSRANFTFLKTQGQSSHFEKVRFVTRITKIIDDLEKSSIREIKKKQLIAEAKMSRGWTMFYLLHMYGVVPVILDPALIGTEAEADLTKPTREIYTNSIISDLEYAAENLLLKPTEYGRFNKGLANVILMRHYLNEKNFSKAEQVGRVIQKLGYKLVPDYMSLFRAATEQNTETIWAVSCQTGPDAKVSQNSINAFPYYCQPKGYPGNKASGWAWPAGAYSATWSFYDTYDANDLRRAMFDTAYIPTWGGAEINRTSGMRGAVILKYPDEDGVQGEYQGNDVVIARYADVLLMLAEAINENSGATAEAIALVDSVRTRAGISKLAPTDYASKQQFRDVLLEERAKELFFEGLRKMDLVRFGKWESALQSVGKTPGPYLFPLPDYAINNSNGTLEQNTGY